MQLNKDVNIFFKAIGKVNNILDITTVIKQVENCNWAKRACKAHPVPKLSNQTLNKEPQGRNFANVVKSLKSMDFQVQR